MSTETLSRRSLWGVAVIFVFFGLLSAFAPMVLAPKAGLFPDASGVTDIRATYGGMQLGFGLFLAWAARDRALHAAAWWACAALVGAVALLRLFGLAVDGAPTGFHYGALGFEIPVTLYAIYLYRRLR